MPRRIRLALMRGVATDLYSGSGRVQTADLQDNPVIAISLGLADGVSQGSASGREFRTAPLWGLGQRLFFLHDGRSGPANGGLVDAIRQHGGRGSEANAVIRKFTALPAADQQAIIDVLRSL